MKKKYIIFFWFLIFQVMQISSAWAQCAMCRATVESNVSDGGNLAAGLNAGILYLAVMPYLIFAGIVYFWFKSSKKYHAQKNKIAGYYRRKVSSMP